MSEEHSVENGVPHEFEGSGGVCHLCGRWDLNGIHDTSVTPPATGREDQP